MKFRLTTKHVYPWPVSVSIPDPEKSGAVIEQAFNMTFQYMPLNEAQALDVEISTLPAREQEQRQHDMLRRVCVGWDDAVVDDDGKPVPFSPTALDAAVQLSWFRIACYRAYFQSLQGKAAEAGN